MSKLDDIFDRFKSSLGISHNEAKQQIKDLFLELMKESYGTSLFGETTARDVYTTTLRKKVLEL